MIRHWRIRRPPRAASGHAAAPPTSVMNCRRFTADSSRASNRKDSTPQLRQDRKPPQAAVVKSDGGERCGKAGT
jgi:hypothetical protein